MIITIDGPAGAGKSSIAKRVAEQLGYDFLDTGAMYRAVTLGVIRQQIDWADVEAMVKFAREADLKWHQGRILLNEVDVSDEIRTPTVTAAIKNIADLVEVRAALTIQQRRIAGNRDIVTDGRDQGTEVFPNADCKIFLTASPEERAKRRQQQLTDQGRFLPLHEILVAQDKRDLEDANRPVGALRPADDAHVIQSDGMTQDEVLEHTMNVIRRCLLDRG